MHNTFYSEKLRVKDVTKKIWRIMNVDAKSWYIVKWCTRCTAQGIIVLWRWSFDYCRRRWNHMPLRRRFLSLDFVGGTITFSRSWHSTLPTCSINVPIFLMQEKFCKYSWQGIWSSFMVCLVTRAENMCLWGSKTQIAKLEDKSKWHEKWSQLVNLEY